MSGTNGEPGDPALPTLFRRRGPKRRLHTHDFLIPELLRYHGPNIVLPSTRLIGSLTFLLQYSCTPPRAFDGPVDSLERLERLTPDHPVILGFCIYSPLISIVRCSHSPKYHTKQPYHIIDEDFTVVTLFNNTKPPHQQPIKSSNWLATPPSTFLSFLHHLHHLPPCPQ